LGATAERIGRRGCGAQAHFSQAPTRGAAETAEVIDMKRVFAGLLALMGMRRHKRHNR
jgi:hypothetical protein